MLDDDVTAALGAITAVADLAALESSEELRAPSDVHVFFFPQCERAHGRGE